MKYIGRSACLMGLAIVAAVCLGSGARAEDKPTDPVAAEKEVREQILKAPGDPQLHYKLGNLLYDQGRRAEAQQSFEKAVELKPDYVKALVNLGVVLNEEGKSAEALTQFDKALAIAPNDVTVLCNKGQAHYAQKEYQKAVDYYVRAMTADPTSPLPHWLLGTAFADVGIYREAIREWRKVVELDPTGEAGKTAAEGIQTLQGLLPPGEQP